MTVHTYTPDYHKAASSLRLPNPPAPPTATVRINAPRSGLGCNNHVWCWRKGSLRAEWRQVCSCWDLQDPPHLAAVSTPHLPPAFVGTVFKPVLGRRTQEGSIMSSLRTMSHSYGHKVSVCFQNAQCCAKIFRNVSLLIGISEDIFAHWPSVDINGVLIPSVIVGDSAYPYWLFLLRSFRRYFETGLV